jgi:alanine racemase
MNRIGFNSDQAEKLSEYFTKSKKLKLKAILSHFAMGEDSHLPDGFSIAQMNEFVKILDFFKEHGIYSHLLNSSGIAGLAKARKLNSADKNNLIETHNWGFRPGLMLYGYQSSSHFSEIDLKPVMSLKSVVNNIRSIKAGESVSYGCTWTATRPSTIAIIPIGYADGIHRLVSNKSHALFAGKKVPIINHMYMDFLILDITNIMQDTDTDQWAEEEVILFGFDEKNNFLSAEEMAAHTNTIVWETLTSVGGRVPRHFKGLKKT